MNDSLLWADVGHRIAPPLPAVETPARRCSSAGGAASSPTSTTAAKRCSWCATTACCAGCTSRRNSSSSARRAWRAIGVDRRDVVQRFEYPPLGRNQVTSALVALDLQLNDQRGLRRWRDGGWQPVAADELAALQGRVLLLVHGTFSESRMYDGELGATAAGRDLFARLTDATGTYAAVLAFDHATLSVAPWLNALALKNALEPLRARLDVVCHSRGGLVVSWALKLAPLPVDQVVFVGTPLMGTSLAAPTGCATRWTCWPTWPTRCRSWRVARRWPFRRRCRWRWAPPGWPRCWAGC
jgi:pimeloyl-ACP methyl ester carboxylesterase